MIIVMRIAVRRVHDVAGWTPTALSHVNVLSTSSIIGSIFVIAGVTHHSFPYEIGFAVC
jgi:hypothetical protein